MKKLKVIHKYSLPSPFRLLKYEELIKLLLLVKIYLY